MDHTFKLPPRLAAIAALVPDGARLADVGTDHALLPIRLLLDGKIQSAVATDIRPGPLSRAKENAYAAGVQDLSCVLCDGLTGVSPDSVDTVVIAGMGGETIISILQDAPWTADGQHWLLLQPMTKAAALRHWLADNGYTFTDEHLVEDKGRIYPILCVEGGAFRPLTEAEALCGVLLADDPLYAAYLTEHITKLRRSAEGLRRSSDPDGGRLAAQAESLAAELEERECKG